MVDSRQKGAKAEADVVKFLSDSTGLNFRRIPMSGALDPVHGLKGDIYVPNSLNIFCIEVKHYADDHFTSKILTDKNPQIIEWWKQTIREAAQVSRHPLLIFKFNRSKLFVAFKDMPTRNDYWWVFINHEHEFYIAKLEDWIKNECPRFI